MLTIHNPVHHLQAGRHEMYRGRLVPCHEVPDRLDHVLAELRRRPLGELREPGEVPMDVLRRIHSGRYLDFLARAWDHWVALDPANAQVDALPSVWPVRGFRDDVLPDNFAARMGLFSFDAGTPLVAGTWQAARAGAACAVDAAQAVASGAQRSAFALTRPPGHHANGTQSIFYARSDVLTVSLHGDPRTEYPFYLGHADERGSGDGDGANLNLPLPRGTDFARWRAALHTGMQAIGRVGAQALVVSLGVDTFEGDPISSFALRSADYLQVGRDIASLRLPTVFVFEGGYAVAEVGVNAVNVLEGFEEAGA
jgi:acetoin utilization deacetylase AcuC-like enzyme